MKRIISIMMTCLFIGLLFCSCSSNKDDINVSTQEAFWKAIQNCENEAFPIFDEIKEKQQVTKDHVEKLEKVQEKLEKIYEAARGSNYYNNVDWFVDDGWGDRYLVTINSRNYSCEDQSVLYKTGTFQIEDKTAACAVFLQNAEGLVGGYETDFYYGEQKIYKINSIQKDAFILVQGLETTPTLYKINRTINYEFIAVIGYTIIGFMSILLFVPAYRKHKHRGYKIDARLYLFCGIVPGILLSLSGLFVIIVCYL